MSTRIQLTSQQRRVLGLSARGYSLQQIGHMLGMSRRVVERHRQEIKLRIGLGVDATKQEMIDVARHLGFLD